MPLNIFVLPVEVPRERFYPCLLPCHTRNGTNQESLNTQQNDRIRGDVKSIPSSLCMFAYGVKTSYLSKSFAILLFIEYWRKHSVYTRYYLLITMQITKK